MKKETDDNTFKPERLTVNAREAAQMLGVSERTIFQLSKAGKLPHKRLGARVVYSIAALKKFIDEPDTETVKPEAS